jgi:hypothetical protein
MSRATSQRFAQRQSIASMKICSKGLTLVKTVESKVVTGVLLQGRHHKGDRELVKYLTLQDGISDNSVTVSGGSLELMLLSFWAALRVSTTGKSSEAKRSTGEVQSSPPGVVPSI